jgi:hypothetical protein
MFLNNQNSKVIILINRKENYNKKETQPHVGMPRILHIKGQANLTNVGLNYSFGKCHASN